jgi:dTDP-4-dehydrorhamnose reductase
MKVLVAGATGQLARALVAVALRPHVDLLALGRPELDLETRQGEARIADFAPDVIINAAAYTAVDAAEKEPERAFAINRDGAVWLAGIAARACIPFVHVSTDYVFDGAKSSAYVETDATGPLGVYGRSKLEGEQAVLHAHPGAIVCRTAWVYSPYGNNFVKTMLRLARERDVLRVVDDQIGNPTSAHDLAAKLLAIGLSGKATPAPAGIYHVAGQGETSWCGFAREIMRLAAESGHRSVPVQPITSADYPTAAKRPANSRLDCTKFERVFGGLPPWQHSLAVTVKTLLHANTDKAPGTSR